MLGGEEKVKELTKKYLDEDWQNLVEDNTFFIGVPKESKYDYRQFLKAKY